MRIINILSSIAVTLSLIAGCSRHQQPRKDIIPREKFVDLYVELLVAGEGGKLSKIDSTLTPPHSPLLDTIYTKYGMTETQVRETIDDYSKDLRQWKNFYGEVIKKLEEMQQAEQSKKQS